MPDLPAGILTNANEVSVISRALTTQCHAMGMAILEIPSIIMKIIAKVHDPDDDARRTWTQLEAAARTDSGRARVQKAKQMDTYLNRIHRHGLCTHPVSGDFVKLNMTGRYRTDTSITIGIRMRTDPPGGQFRFRPTSMIAWGVSSDEDVEEIDGEDTDVELLLFNQNPNVGINRLIRTGRVAEIDVVCGGQDSIHFWHTRGGGVNLLAYTLSKIAQRKRAGERRFAAVITYLAEDETGSFPLESGMRRLGFQEIKNSWWRIEGQGLIPTGRKYFILQDDGNQKWIRKLQNALHYDPEMANVCPLVPHTGKGYCR